MPQKKLAEQLLNTRPHAAEASEELNKAADAFCEGYKAFISDNKTERECCAAAVTMAEEAGYVSLASRIESGEPLRPGGADGADGVGAQPLQQRRHRLRRRGFRPAARHHQAAHSQGRSHGAGRHSEARRLRP